MKNTYTIRDLIALLLGKIWLIIILAILGGLGSFLVSEFMIHPRYESYTTMYVKNIDTLTAEQHSDVDINDLDASKSLASTYITVLNSNAVMTQVGEELLQQYTPEALEGIFAVHNGTVSTDAIKGCFSMTAVNETEVIQITANTEDPQISADLCNIIADVAPEFLIRIVGAGSVEIIDTAVPNESPVSPNVSFITLVGAVVGLGVAILLILLIDFFNDTIKGTEELTEVFEKAILGEVQSVSMDKKKRRAKKEDPDDSRAQNLLTDSSIPFNVAESYRTIRANILFTLGTSEKKVIAVSSPNPNEGKSSMAANIALALAQNNSKVLLIDGDMRRPVQHKTFKLKNSEGLSTLIIKSSKVEESIQKGVHENFDVLPSGPMPPNPSELLATESFQKLVEQFSQDYDYVVIDTPPINVVSDAMVIQDAITGILIVLRYGVTTYDDVADCMKQVNFAQSNVLGFVLNDVHYAHGGSHNNYKYKYRYKDYSYSNCDRNPEQQDWNENDID